MKKLVEQIKHIEKQYVAGTLSFEDIEHASQIAQDASNEVRQSLLSLHATSTNPYSSVVGISIYEDGVDSDGLDERGSFRYSSIKDALDDGWRIIKFPETSLAVYEQDNYGLGYEFVLERWR